MFKGRIGEKRWYEATEGEERGGGEWDKGEGRREVAEGEAGRGRHRRGGCDSRGVGERSDEE